MHTYVCILNYIQYINLLLLLVITSTLVALLPLPASLLAVTLTTYSIILNYAWSPINAWSCLVGGGNSIIT